MPLGRDRRRVWTQGERRTARDLGGRGTPGSGNQWHSKGDVSAADVLAERKDTSAASYSLTLKVLDKIATEANMADKKPLLVIGFSTGQEFAVIPMADYLAMRGDE